MIRALGGALALVLALGDVSWAAKLESVVVSKSGPAASIPTLAVPALKIPAAGVELVSETSRAEQALPQLQTAALPMQPQAQEAAGAAQAEQAARWDGAKAAEASAPEPVAAAAAQDHGSGLAAFQTATPPASRIPGPRVALGKAGLLASHLGLVGAGVLTHAPFDRLAPLVLGLVMGVFMAVPVVFYVAAASQSPGWGRGEAPGPRPVSGDDWEHAKRQTERAAKAAGIPGPKRFDVFPKDVLNAQAGGGLSNDYEVNLWGGVLDLPAEQREAILHHEIAHVKHADVVWTALSYGLAALPAVTTLVAGAVADWRAYLALPLLAGSVLVIGAFKKLQELQADQHAAAMQGTGKPLIAAFEEMQRRDGPPGLWDRLSWPWRAHPSLDYRIRRLRALEESLRRE